MLRRSAARAARGWQRAPRPGRPLRSRPHPDEAGLSPGGATLPTVGVEVGVLDRAPADLDHLLDALGAELGADPRDEVERRRAPRGLAPGLGHDTGDLLPHAGRHFVAAPAGGGADPG